MTYDELCISFERLQRFNSPFKKHERVYRDILLKHLICPKISLKGYHEINIGDIKRLVQFIWNESVKNIKPDCEENNFINLYLLYEELKERSAKEVLKKFIFSPNIQGFTKPANFCDSDFISDEDVLIDIFEHNGISFSKENYGLDTFSEIYIGLGMNYPLNLDGFLQIAEEKKDKSANIKRLIWLNKQVKKENNIEKIYEAAKSYRDINNSGKPLNLVILGEGATEEILLPKFSAVVGVDFAKNGVEIINSGGKNQAARIYSELHKELNLPIFIILDSDAQQIAEEINNNLRPQDRLYLISKGEFEDILPDNLVCRAINSHYGLSGIVKKSEINVYESRTNCLSELWKQKGFGEFKKAEFAQIISENISSASDLSDEMRRIIYNIQEML